MNHQYTLLFLFITGLFFGSVYADSISSSIVSTGAAFVSSSVIGPGNTLTQSLFTTDPALILRDLIVRDDIQSKTLVHSTGSMGIDEYSFQMTNQTDDSQACFFDMPKNQSIGYQKTMALGLLQEGVYTSTRSMKSPGDASRYILELNGTGMILTRAATSDSNQTLSHASDVAGEMNITEVMQFGEEYDF